MGGDIDKYLTAVFANLPPAAKSVDIGLRRARARWEMGHFFRGYAQRDWTAVRRSFWRAIRRDPFWLLNRGVLSMFLESVVGTQLMRSFRRTARLFFRRDANRSAQGPDIDLT